MNELVRFIVQLLAIVDVRNKYLPHLKVGRMHLVIKKGFVLNIYTLLSEKPFVNLVPAEYRLQYT